MNCFKCGAPGHWARQCTTETQLCYNCHQPGHVQRDCPQPRICHYCGSLDHMMRDCPKTGQNASSNQLFQMPGLLGHQGLKCFSCGDYGHRAANCNRPEFCFSCGRPGHLARDCDQRPGCFKCSLPGHFARECPNQDQKWGGECVQ